MKNKFTLCMIFIIICSAFSFANEFGISSVNLDSKYNGNFRINNNIVRFGAGSSYGKVASDREAINNNNFKLFKLFRNASIGMFVPGALIFTASVIPVSILTAIILTEADAVGGSAAAIAAAFESATTYIPFVGICIAFLAVSGVLLACGIIFSICAGVFHYKWAEEKGITAYNSLSSDKPQFAQGFSITL